MEHQEKKDKHNQVYLGQPILIFESQEQSKSSHI